MKYLVAVFMFLFITSFTFAFDYPKLPPDIVNLCGNGNEGPCVVTTLTCSVICRYDTDGDKLKDAYCEYSGDCIIWENDYD